MNTTPTEQFVQTLGSLKAGELALLRSHAGHRLDETLEGFDLFTGIWWPLREQSPRAPRREIAWLVTKAFATYPTAQEHGRSLPIRLRQVEPREMGAQRRHSAGFDALLMTPLANLEPALRWALRRICAQDLTLDWVQLTDDLSIWERQYVRLNWAKQYIAKREEEAVHAN